VTQPDSPNKALADFYRCPGEFVLGRISVEPTDWALEFRLKLLGAYRWLPQAIALKRKLKAYWKRSLSAEIQKRQML
jgi:hypothetical protein